MKQETIKKLQGLYSGENEEFRYILDFIRQFQVGDTIEAEPTVEWLEENDPDGDWARPDVVQCMKELDHLSLAKFTKGAKGKRSRINLYYPGSAIADAGYGKPESLLELLESSPDQPKEPAYAPSRIASTTSYHGKSVWTYGEIKDLLARLSGFAPHQIKIHLTISEGKTVFADSQNISPDDVRIHLG